MGERERERERDVHTYINLAYEITTDSLSWLGSLLTPGRERQKPPYTNSVASASEPKRREWLNTAGAGVPTVPHSPQP